MADGNTTGKTRRTRKAPAPTTPDPIEIAMAAEAHDGAPDSPARRLLIKQERLVGWEIADRRAAFGLKLLLGLVGLGAAALIAWACWDASRAAGIAVAPFETSPALAAQGFTGEAAANELVSRLSTLQAATSSVRQGRRSAATTDSVTLVIPQTGVSVGEAQRLLRSALGHEIHVSGTLRPAVGGGLTLSVRVDGRRVEVEPPPPEQAGDAEAWLERGAQAVMRETDAFRYAVWLVQQGRGDEAIAMHRRRTQSGPASERAWSWSGLSSIYRTQGRIAEALAAAREAVRLDPTLPVAWIHMGSAENHLGHSEAAHAHLLRAEMMFRRAGGVASDSNYARFENDWRRVDASASVSIAAPPRYTDGARASHYMRILSLLARHDLAAARIAKAGLDPPFDPLLGGLVPALTGALEPALLEDWAGLERVMSAPWPASPLFGQTPLIERTVRVPWRAYAVARLGRLDEARALIGTTATDCYLCLIMRGRIEALARQPAAAEGWFAEAARQAPSLADAEQAWGEARLARGDAAGALALFRIAARKAPGWAEPLKGEGDALVRLNRPAEALKPYAAAADRAPRWGGLHLAWGEALAKRGKTEEARAKWRAAATMHLSPADHAALKARRF